MISGSRKLPSLFKARASSHAMHIPSSKRFLSKNGLPWGGIMGVCIVASICVNIYSVTLNKFQFGLLDKLKFPNFGFDDFDEMTKFSDSHGLQSVSDFHRLLQASNTSGSNTSSLEAAVRGSAPQGRRASSTAGSSSASCTIPSASGGHHGNHPHDNMLFLFNAFFIGAAVMQLSAKYPILQQTIVLFVIGFVCSLILKGLKVNKEVGVWGASYDMWMDIDPHLLLFTLLPALLAGDAMTIDTSVAKRVALQCIYLAGPGVLIGGFGTAAFLNVFIDWQTEKKFLISLCAGSILCATDPVAVVALLKELGASPMLTVQIQGESLLNDGTAIVLYLISYNMLSGQDYDWIEIITFLVEKALMAFALGLFMGYFFFGWIRAVANKLEHSSGMIQITLTLCCAYWSFIFVEGILGLSGVLATVASSLVLAHHMWPYVVAPESMHHVWHTFESLGNIIVFFLGGCITGSIVLDIDAIDLLNLLVIYIVLLCIRSALMFGSRPILKYLHQDNLPVSWQDATLMTWGGLRGAVGLALAIQVNNGKAPHWATCGGYGCVGDPTCTLNQNYISMDTCETLTKIQTCGNTQIHPKDAQRLLFFVSGIAFLTTLVNATTAPMLVHKLGITALPAARQTLLKMFHQQLVNWSEDSDTVPPEVTASLKEMLHHAAEEIENQQVSTDKSLESGRSGGVGEGEKQKLNAGQKFPGQETLISTNKDLVTQLGEVEAKFQEIPLDKLQLLGSGGLPENLNCEKRNEKGEIDLENGKYARHESIVQMVKLIEPEDVDIGMAKVVNQCFLTLVFNNYWKLIEEGALRPGSPESDVLLTSIRVSLSPYRADLTDFAYVHNKMIGKETIKTDDIAEDALAEDVPEGVPTTGCLPGIVNSMKFNLTIVFAILLNSVMVIVEELARDSECGDDPLKAFWIALDAVFTFIFIMEFVLKFAWLKLMYFKDPWNRFDFFLVVVGAAGLVMNLMTDAGGDLKDQARVMKLARVLRTLRFLRVFRLFNARLSADKFVSMELAKHMKKITTMACFITAHFMAQNDLIKYFGGNGVIDEREEAEIARCIVQSQVSTYNALIAAANTQSQISPKILDELKSLYARKAITESLSHFVEKAHSDGAISATEAHSILHPLNHQVSACMKTLSDRAEGVLDAPGAKPAGHGHGHGGGDGEEPQAVENKPASDMAPSSEAAPAAPEVEAVPAADAPATS